ncbi:MAG: S8 family serine peptidase [Desulfuromonadales bacterium]|nr:S8 family serine peptidase [Desulfuromonadales bacterium]
MHKAFVLLIVSALAGVLLNSVAQAAALAPEVRQRMAMAGVGDKVPVIIHFTDRLDVKAFAQRSNRAAARAGMVRGLRDQARRSQGSLQGFLRGQGVEPTELWLINALAVQVPPHLVETLAAWPGVAAVELDGEVPRPAPVTLAIPAAPSDNIAAIGAQSLWAAGFTGSGVVVASFDSGVDVTHPDLAAPRWRGGANDWFDPYAGSLTPRDIDGHGTAVTSLMVGGGASGRTIGVAPDARWIAAKIFPDSGDAISSKIIESFQWAVDPDDDPATDDAPDVINNSWGFEKNLNQCLTDIVHQDNPRNSLPLAIQTVQDLGIHVVFAAGNGGPAAATSVSPANYPGGLAVGSVGPNFAVSSFSSLGPSACSGSIYNDLAVDVYPELVAPGESVTVANPLTPFTTGYGTASGTSFTAPHVSGALALLRSAIPPLADESAQDYRLRLEMGLLTTAVDLGPPGADNSYGRGLVDLPAAYARLTAQQYLLVFDPIAPEYDDLLNFGPVTPGTVKELSFVLKNTGVGNLVITDISSSLPAPELTLIANTCVTTLPSGAQCNLTVRFAPIGFVSLTGQITIVSNEALRPTRILTVTGIGNSLPPPAQLLAPENNAVFVTSPVTFSWAQRADLDGDALNMTLLIDTDPHFDPPTRTILVSVFGISGVMIATLGFVWPWSSRRRLQLLIIGTLAMLWLMVACGGGGGGTTVVATDSIVVGNLAPATTYYWKVQTVDSHGGVSESAVWSFTTR